MLNGLWLEINNESTIFPISLASSYDILIFFYLRKSKYYYFINTEERTKPELSVKSIIEQSQGQLTWKAGLLWLRLIVTNLLSDCHTKNKVLRYPTNQTEWSDWSNTMMASNIR